MKQLHKLTTADMEIALTHRDNSPVCFLNKKVVLNKCASIFGHEVDLVAVSDAGYCTEIEIKISKGDFLADFKKKVGHTSGYIKYFYYAVPYYMVDYVKERLPEDAGLIEIIPAKPVGIVKIIKQAPQRKNIRKITDNILNKLQRYMSMRYWSRQRALRKYFWDEVVNDYNKEQKNLTIKKLKKRILKNEK